jgi:hypothetical protein
MVGPAAILGSDESNLHMIEGSGQWLQINNEGYAGFPSPLLNQLEQN